ncbi:hypothetical protein AVEN_65919-1 [Araneus ventricosus]|uniref:Uncharacterized protein n=1 Tax=Araneus ventricosus TaxID=182803 RepID=A0A4Y2WDR8_ARAVE|nr:hypothetical protein AVEN_65919-1 [Araneus ventricosus]
MLRLFSFSRSQIAKKACLKGFGNLVVSKSKGLNLSARFASQQETRFLVRFPQAFITSLLRDLLQWTKYNPLPPYEVSNTPSSKTYSYKLQIPPSRGSNPRS